MYVQYMYVQCTAHSSSAVPHLLGVDSVEDRANARPPSPALPPVGVPEAVAAVEVVLAARLAQQTRPGQTRGRVRLAHWGAEATEAVEGATGANVRGILHWDQNLLYVEVLP